MRRALSLLLALVLVAGFLLNAQPAQAASAKDCKRAIGVVFDNSGSMYIGSADSKKAWCRATYATEAFAAMMNSGDVMQVYPMNPIEVGGKVYTYEDPLVIDQSSASTIRQIYTPKPGDTHIETITAACDGLMKTSADEKWLVVLTDGDEFYRDGRALGKGKGTISALEEDLSACNAQVNVMYLGMGSQSAMPDEVTGNYIYHSEKTTNSAEVLEALSDMCNTIFGRDSLPEVDDTVPFDVSMSKLILFIQGEGIQNVKLDGKAPDSVKEMRYSTQGGGGDYTGTFLVDETLQGVMAIYTNLDAGEYPLSYDGTASSVECYYEPDVDLVAEFLDASGTPIDPNSELISGEYILRYALVDRYGQEATSELLGNTEYEISCNINGEPLTADSDRAGSLILEMNPNDQLDAQVKVTYLDGYTIIRDSDDLGWPAGGLTFLPPAAGTLEAKLSGGASKYTIGDLPEQEPFRVEFIYDGQTLTGAQLDSMEQLKGVVEGGNVGCKIGRDEQGIYASLDYYGSVPETECGDFSLRVSGVYRNEDGLLTNVAADTADFTLEDNSRQLQMELVDAEKYYQISQLDKAEPILAKLTFDGQPLTPEELDEIDFTCQCDSCDILVEKDYENSAYSLRFDSQNPPETGKHKIRLTAAGINESGRETVDEKKLTTEVGTIPPWLRMALPILALLLLILLLILILNQKVLPKGVYVKEMEFSVDGETIDIKRSPDFDGAGKSKGYIKIYSPKAGTDPMAEQAIFLDVAAISPRRTPSRQRKAKVTMAKLKSPQNVIYWKLKTHAYEPDPEKPGGFIHNVTGTPGFKEVDIGPTTEVEIQADTDSSSVIFRCKIGFK